MQFQIHVKFLRRGVERDICVPVSMTTPMHAVKAICTAVVGENLDDYDLVFDGFPLDDNDTASLVGLEPGFQLDLVRFQANPTVLEH